MDSDKIEKLLVRTCAAPHVRENLVMFLGSESVGTPRGWTEYKFISDDDIGMAKEFFAFRNIDVSTIDINGLDDKANTRRRQEIFKDTENKWGAFATFGGQGYCEDCDGWDMVSRRCQCGNRRVCWEVDKIIDFRNPAAAYYVYAEAY
jgi:hypothetical protein